MGGRVDVPGAVMELTGENSSQGRGFSSASGSSGSIVAPYYADLCSQAGSGTCTSQRHLSAVQGHVFESNHHTMRGRYVNTQ